ncbi:ATP-binding protein [Weeksella virosa]|uniref:sensor histidine kinase n=1 Tax=Weeksella virosa TaxID=1014 RepID=UPI002553EADF|nr:ATP-binding protein [Weeksella virosa]MDK7674484.1 ATP-binding protein [Weeksella virosa]
MAKSLKKMHSFGWGFFATLIVYVLMFVLYYVWFQNFAVLYQYKAFLFVTFLVSTLILTIIIHFNNKRQRRTDLRQFSSILPVLDGEETLDFEDISQKFTTITEDQTKEIDILIERENYRREFLGNISHELKTPLFSVQGYLLTLIEGGVEDEKIRDKYLNRINKSVDRLIFLVKDLDMITELEREKIKLHQTTFNLTALVQESIDLLEIKAVNKNIDLYIKQPVNPNLRVKGDLEKIQQVLINLIANAINYSDEGTKVSIQLERQEDKVKVAVKDEGVGIKESDIERIFERFYRVEKSRSRNNGGSGLGLAIVKHILEAHQQKITVKSKPGQGSVFSFYLEAV